MIQYIIEIKGVAKVTDKLTWALVNDAGHMVLLKLNQIFKGTSWLACNILWYGNKVD